MQHNSDFKFDLQFGIIGETLFAEIFNNKKVEVKYDRIAHNTNNIFIELKCRGKWSGISMTHSEYFVYIIEKTGVMIIFPTQKLKIIIKKLIQNNQKIIRGGDNNQSVGLLLNLNKIGYYNSLL